VPDQDEVIAFLARGSEARAETHISIVFLHADTAYKLKRAVRFSYLDYSAPARRKAFCEAELALNRRTAPQLYRRVRAITRAASGGLEFDGPGEAVDYVLEMQRFAEADLFDSLARAGKLTARLLRDLTDNIVAFHQRAERTPRDGAALLRGVVAGNAANLAKAGFDPVLVEQVNTACRAVVEAHAPLLAARGEGIRRCHGDLHLGNIVLWQGQPLLFDCIEFCDDFACIDPLYDLAFLLMDLLHRGERCFAALVFNRYLDRTAEAEGMAAMPLFIAVRAVIRAHVLAAQGRAEEGRTYLALAAEVLCPATPHLLAIGGVSGSGKSTLAAAVAPELVPVPGARVLRTDVLRKILFGVAPETRLPENAYTPQMSARVYAEMHNQAMAALAAGYSVILDAAFLRQEERDAASALAACRGVDFTGVWLDAPDEVLIARLDARRDDASDAGAAVLRRQRELETGEIRWTRIDAAQPKAVQRDAVMKNLARG
jgi:aminoglycoside phosphotransferase family enzyme/predicted kinase